jgi:type I restriction enzyme S subunit
MADWKEENLKNLNCSLLSGFAFKSTDYVNIGIPLIKIGNIQGQSVSISDKGDFVNESIINSKISNYLLKNKDVLIAMTGQGSVGRVGRLKINENEVALLNQRVGKFICDEKKLNIDFLFYILSSEKYQDVLFNSGAGSGQPNLSPQIILDTEIPSPPYEIQRTIASILSSLDDKIDLLHRQNKTLEAMAETLFRQWFVEEVDESWEVGTLGEFIETTLGGEWGKENPEGDFQLQVQCIRGTDIADLETGIPERTPIRFIKQKKYESIEIKDGDLIMEISGGTDDQSTGRTAYINNEVKALFKHPLVFSNFCRLIRPKKKEYSFFLYSFIHYLYKQDELFNLENGSSGIKNLDYKSLLFSMEYKLPSLESSIKYHHDVKQYFYKINKNKSQILILTQLRDNLLPKLMSGEVSVK